MTDFKERKNRPLADLRYDARQGEGKPTKKSVGQTYEMPQLVIKKSNGVRHEKDLLFVEVLSTTIFNPQALPFKYRSTYLHEAPSKRQSRYRFFYSSHLGVPAATQLYLLMILIHAETVGARLDAPTTDSTIVTTIAMLSGFSLVPTISLEVSHQTVYEILLQIPLPFLSNPSQQNRPGEKTYLKELLPHVYREDLLLLLRRMNRYFRLNPEVDVGLELWRDVNMLCQSLHPDDVEDCSCPGFDEWEDFPPSYCRDVVVAGNIIQTVQAGLRQAYECIASAPIACTARQMVFSSPWLTAKKESGSPLQTALLLGKGLSNLLMFFDVATLFDYVVHRVHAVSFDAAILDVAATVSAACIVAAGYIVSAGICDAAVVSAGISSSVSAGSIIEFMLEDLEAVPAGHVLISADRYRIC
ncbi:hypothetical protein Tco_1428360 [Tanacetum coccineum]